MSARGLRRPAAAAALLGAALLAGACLGTSPAVPADRYHRLDPDLAGLPAFDTPPVPGHLEVTRLRGNAVTTQRAVAWSEAGGAGPLHQHAYDHWVDPPPEMLQELLVRALRESGVAQEVAAPEALARGDYRVSGRLVRFERVLGGGEPRVAVEVRLTVTRLRGREAVLSATYREEVPAEGDSVAAAVPAFEAAVGRVLERFLRDLAGAFPS